MAWFDSGQMVAFGAAALEAVGIERNEAELTSRSLVSADQRGVFSHGLLRLPLYVSAVEAGGINRDASMRWVAEHGATAVLDADAALGQVAMQQAVDRVIALARSYGVGVVVVQGSSHFGAGAFWAEQLASAGCLALLCSTTGPVVAPFGGAEKVFGTNPLTMIAPAGQEESLLVDMATSNGAYGKIVAAKNAGETIPDGWAVGPDGRPTIDPATALAGALIPFGGHKGSSIAAALEAFSAVLGTGSFAYETEDIWHNPASRMNIGQLIIAIDPEFFTGRAHTEARVAGLLAKIRASAPDGDRVFAPGDVEQGKRRSSGERVQLGDADVAALRELAERLRLAFPPPLA